MSHPDLEKLVSAVQTAPKYKQIVPSLIERIALDEFQKGRKYKDALKNTKSKLHQVGAAYQPGKMNYARWLEDLTHAKTLQDKRAICAVALQNHASTKERLPILDNFYREIFAALPKFNSILDIACGLNPLTTPWMSLPPKIEYYACDIYMDMMEFFNQAFPLLGLSGVAFPCDVVASPPDRVADVAFVFKTIPCLEQVDKTAGERLLNGLNAKHIVVTFPTKSLGGRGKGMVENYTRRMDELTSGKNWEIKQLNIAEELVFIVQK